jgi:hypothetical protein
MALLIALAVRLSDVWRVAASRYDVQAIVMLIVAMLWVFARDTNAWVLFGAALVILAISVASREWRRGLPLAAVLIVCFIASAYSADRAERWLTPFQNVICLRVLPDASKTAYFAAHGLPVTPALLDRAGKPAWSDNFLIFRSAGLKEFRDWMHDRGKKTYVEFLLTHPVSTMRDPMRDLATLISPDVSAWHPAELRPILAGVSDAFYWPAGAAAWALGGLLCAIIAAGVSFRSGDARLVVPAILMLVAFPHALVVWHGDAMTLMRHSIEIGLHLRLGIWLALLIFADRWLRNRERVDSHA